MYFKYRFRFIFTSSTNSSITTQWLYFYFLYWYWFICFPMSSNWSSYTCICTNTRNWIIYCLNNWFQLNWRYNMFNNWSSNMFSSQRNLNYFRTFRSFIIISMISDMMWLFLLRNRRHSIFVWILYKCSIYIMRFIETIFYLFFLITQLFIFFKICKISISSYFLFL